ncbi:MAG: hypothetical protein JJLCMIEE_01565 [Acidimicrobiales bacterium]|nr:MAG: amino acid ABC transporter substrate-binding protein [Actinomycetota bacterium]MBV6508501.1 hypothetical protein [Acidimicrobiales bacterium]RIK05183.1 MAG: branched-chain amino acid ABC transporter substrate-binding protein [Acidobacteriota bacterium]
MARKGAAWRFSALLIAFGLAAAACSDDESGDTTTTTEANTVTTEGEATTTGGEGPGSDGTFALGSILPLTGELAEFGPGMQAAVEMAVADINAAGGVNGSEVTLTKKDSANDVETAGPAAESLVNSDDVDAVIGAASSGVTLAAVIDTVTGAERLECSGSTTGPQLTEYGDGGYFFRTAPSDLYQAQVLVDLIAAEGYASVAIVYRDDTYGDALAAATADILLEEVGVEVSEIAMDPNGTDFSNDVEQIVNEDPGAILLIAYQEEGARLLEEMIKQGIGPADKPILVTDGLASEELASAVDPDDPAVLNAMRGTRPASEGEPTEFNERLMAEYGVATTFGPRFYDCVMVLALAAEEAGTDDPTKVVEQVIGITKDGEACTSFAECKAAIAEGTDIKYEGVTSFEFNEFGEPDRGIYQIWHFDTEGLIVPDDTVTVGVDGASDE